MRAAIDIGSNSILLLVTDGEPATAGTRGSPTVHGTAGAVVHDEARVVGLGRGLGERGVFRPDRMEEAVSVLRDYANRARELGVPANEVRAVATSASRRALNATTFFTNVQRTTGLRVEVISGDEEARTTWIGSLTGVDLHAGPVLLCDPGGGSTELILGEGAHIRQRVSLEIGTVRLTEKHLGYGQVDPAALSRARAEIDAAMAEVRLDAVPHTAVAVAGTATSLSAATLGQTTFDGVAVHNSLLSAAALRTWIDMLLAANPGERRTLMACSPERADTVLIGACILLRALETARRQSWRVSSRGLRFGLLAG